MASRATARGARAALGVKSASPATASSATTDLEGIHRKNRNRSGRVARNVERVKAKGLVAYRNEVLARVGKLAAGWAPAAAYVGGPRLPAWVARHATTGRGAHLDIRADRISLHIANITPWADNVKGMARRLQWALVSGAMAGTMRHSLQ